MKQTLVVKAVNVHMAKRYAEQEGFEVCDVRDTMGRRQFAVSVIIDIEKACNWFLRREWNKITHPPFPNGTLLWYNAGDNT